MDDDLDITPEGKSTPQIRLYRDSLDVIDRRQLRSIKRHDPTEGGPAGSTSTGVGPADLVFQGDWLGDDAAELADRLESIIDDESVTTVDVAGATTSTRYDGTYRIADEPADPQPAPQTDRVWKYELRLINKT